MPSTLDPSICCPTCRIAGTSATSRAVDLSCEDCCVRHLLRIIEDMGKYGTAGHSERIKDKLTERLIRE